MRLKLRVLRIITNNLRLKLLFLRIFWASKSKKLRIFEPHFGQVDSYKKKCVYTQRFLLLANELFSWNLWSPNTFILWFLIFIRYFLVRMCESKVFRVSTRDFSLRCLVIEKSCNLQVRISEFFSKIHHFLKRGHDF